MKTRILLLLSVLQVSWIASAQPIPCRDYKFEPKEYSFNAFNPPAEVYGGVAYPGTTQVLYRGAYESNPQFNFEKALKGLFFEKNWYIGSPVFWGITQVLTGKWTLENTFIPPSLPYPMRYYLDARKILPDVNTLLECAGNRTYSLEQAEILAADLMNKAFSRMSSAQVESRYFNILDPEYYKPNTQKIGFGNNAADLIISTTYDLISALYGNKILVLNDTRKRALDLGFYNLKKNGILFQHWVDNGEINSPGYIQADELLGYQQRKVDRAKTNWAPGLPDNPIDFAVYRHKIDGENVILLLDGGNSPCISKASNDQYFHCPSYWENLMKVVPSPYPSVSRNKVTLMGIITDKCEAKENCPIINKVKAWYNYFSSRALDPAWVKRIEDLSVNGKALLYHPTPYVPKPVPKIEVISASYLTDEEATAGRSKNNAKKAAAEFLDGKIEETYRISSRYIGLRGPNVPRTFEITWKCTNSKADPQTVTVPAPAENQRIPISCKEK